MKKEGPNNINSLAESQGLSEDEEVKYWVALAEKR